MLHKYLIADIEVSAYRRYIRKVEELAFISLPFLTEWQYFRPDEYPPPSKKEKMVYLSKILQVPNYKTAKYLKASPNHVIEVVNTYSFQRNYKDDASLDLAITTWKRYRALLPDEIFIKYI